jgi:hypothetical protein
MPGKMKPFNRKTLEKAFERLGELAWNDGKTVEISVYGGSALVLSMNFRVSTHDVDAVFDADRTFVRKSAKLVAEEFGWEPDWINDGVKGFLSAQDDSAEAKSLFRSYPSEIEPGLRVFVASPSYLFAMKCLAMRVGGAEASEDVDDIRHLGKKLGIKTAADAFAVVARYYPANRLSPKTQFGVEEIFGK